MAERKKATAQKGKKRGKNGKNNTITEHKELVLKEDGQEYAKVIKALGTGHVEADCFDGKKRRCHIRGKMCKRVWINAGNIILIGLRNFQDKTADVILKYTDDEARRLKSMGELPESTDIESDGKIEENKECPFDFESI